MHSAAGIQKSKGLDYRMPHNRQAVCWNTLQLCFRQFLGRPLKATCLSSLVLLVGLASLTCAVDAQTYPSVSTYTFAGANPNLGGGTISASVTFTVTASGLVNIDLTNTYSVATTTNTDVLEGVLFDTTLTTKGTAATAASGWARVVSGSYLLKDSAGTSAGGGGTDINANGGGWMVKTGIANTDGHTHDYGVGDTGAYSIHAGGGAGAGGIVSKATYPGTPPGAQVGKIARYPYVDNEAIFNLSGITGLTDVNQIINVYFIYSSAGTNSLPGTRSSTTPEPGTCTMFGAAMVTGVVWIRKRKRARQ